MTPLDRFIRAKDLDANELARIAQVSGAHLLRLRSGRTKPTPDVIKRITKACAWITGDAVYSWELFDRI